MQKFLKKTSGSNASPSRLILVAFFTWGTFEEPLGTLGNHAGNLYQCLQNKRPLPQGIFYMFR